MGAQTFTVRESGESPEDAFSAAVEQAQYMYGHAGYTGTIAEKGSFTLIPESEVGDEDPMEFADELINNRDHRINDKWGPAGAIKTGENSYLFFGWASC